VIHVAGQVETYLARSLGFTLLALALVTVVLTGSVPIGSIADREFLFYLYLYLDICLKSKPKAEI